MKLKQSLLWMAASAVFVFAGSGCGDHCSCAARRPDGSIDGIGIGTNNGEVAIQVKFNNCPKVSPSAAPPAAPIGTSIIVAASASDLDLNNLTFAWTAPSGSFDEPTKTTTSFHCAVIGPVVLTVTVSDGTCLETSKVSVTCSTPDGGAGAGS